MKLNELITESRAALSMSFRRTFGQVHLENRAGGVRVTVEARHPDPESFKQAIEYSLNRAGYQNKAEVTVHDGHRATVKFL